MLSRDEYYRPSRARELARRAQILERWDRRLPSPIWVSTLVPAGASGLGLAICLVARTDLPVWLIPALIVGATFLGTMLSQLRASLSLVASRYREEAEALVGEHEAKHLPH